MPTIIHEAGFRVVIFPRDHPPAHVHVKKADGEAIINLEPLEIRELYRMSRRDANMAYEIVEANLARLIGAWRKTHAIDN